MLEVYRELVKPSHPLIHQELKKFNFSNPEFDPSEFAHVRRLAGHA